MRKLTRSQFEAYAKQQIEAAARIVAQHRPTRSGWCSCAREWPCSVVASCRQRRDHFEVKLALLDATISLPVIKDGIRAPDQSTSLWLRLFGRRPMLWLCTKARLRDSRRGRFVII